MSWMDLGEVPSASATGGCDDGTEASPCRKRETPWETPAPSPAAAPMTLEIISDSLIGRSSSMTEARMPPSPWCRPVPALRRASKILLPRPASRLSISAALGKTPYWYARMSSTAAAATTRPREVARPRDQSELSSLLLRCFSTNSSKASESSSSSLKKALSSLRLASSLRLRSRHASNFTPACTQQALEASSSALSTFFRMHSLKASVRRRVLASASRSGMRGTRRISFTILAYCST